MCNDVRSKEKQTNKQATSWMKDLTDKNMYYSVASFLPTFDVDCLILFPNFPEDKSSKLLPVYLKTVIVCLDEIRDNTYFEL